MAPLTQDVGQISTHERAELSPRKERNRNAVARTISRGHILGPSEKPKPMSSCSKDFLYKQGFSYGLIKALERNKREFPLSIWMIDNSSSMAKRDGHRVGLDNKLGGVNFTECSRWEEMQQTVNYHEQMSAILNAPTVFRMLNNPGKAAGPQQFSIAKPGTKCTFDDLNIAQAVMRKSKPYGDTPLAECLRSIHESVIGFMDKLRENGNKRVVLVIATDGVPTDEDGNASDEATQEFAEALRSLSELPVWVVVRLCTDDEAVVNFWNNFDDCGEFDLEVLDDFVSEAMEIHEHNKWLNYGFPLHRMREMGFYDDVFDILDERELTREEVGNFLKILLGSTIMSKAPPIAEWKRFCDYVGKAVASEKKQWNPISQKMEPWIDIKQLKRNGKQKLKVGEWLRQRFH